MGFIKDVLEGLSGTSKMGYGKSLYDPTEGKKWRDRQEKHYQSFGDREKRYSDQATKYLGMYGKSRAKADSMYDSAATQYGKSGSDIERSRAFQRSADALMGDRAFYAELAKDRERVKRGYQDARLEQEALRSELKRAGSSQTNMNMMRDAFQEIMMSEEEALNNQTAELAKTNPVAAAKLKLDFQAKMQKGYGKALQEGFGRDVQLDMNKIIADSGLVLKGAGLLEGEALQNARAFSERQSRIGNYGNASTAALNTASSQQNLGSGYAGIAGGLSDLASRDLSAGMNYENMGYNALKNQASTSNLMVSQNQQREMSDANARAQVDNFNNNRASRGLSNALAMTNTGLSLYGNIKAGNLATAQADYLRSGLGVADTLTSNQNVSIPQNEALYKDLYDPGMQAGMDSQYTGVASNQPSYSNQYQYGGPTLAGNYNKPNVHRIWDYNTRNANAPMNLNDPTWSRLYQGEQRTA